MKSLVLGLALASGACTGFYRDSMPRAPYCVMGGGEPVSMSMMDYGTSYTPDLSGTLEAMPTSYLAPAADAGAECVSPPGWSPPESAYH